MACTFCNNNRPTTLMMMMMMMLMNRTSTVRGRLSWLLASFSF